MGWVGVVIVCMFALKENSIKIVYGKQKLKWVNDFSLFMTPHCIHPTWVQLLTNLKWGEHADNKLTRITPENHNSIL